MQLPLRLRLVSLGTALVAHALVIVAMLSALHVGTSSRQVVRDGQLERASPVSVVEAFILSCPDCRSAEIIAQNPTLPSSLRPHLKPVRMSLFPILQWGAESSRTLLSATSRLGIAGVRCEVHIHQDAHGHIQAVDLGPCTENAVWQQTLLRRIMQAAALTTPSTDPHFPELTLTLSTNRISVAVLARVLSDPVMARPEETPGKIVIWRHQ